MSGQNRLILSKITKGGKSNSALVKALTNANTAVIKK